MKKRYITHDGNYEGGIEPEQTEAIWLPDRASLLDSRPIFKQVNNNGVDYII